MITGDFTFDKVSVDDDTSLDYKDQPQSARSGSDGENVGGLSITGVVVVVIIVLIVNWYSSDRFLLEVTETTRPPLIIIDYSHFSCMSGNHYNSD